MAEPTLVNKFSKKAFELEQLIQSQSSENGSIDRSSNHRMQKLASRTHHNPVNDSNSKRVTIVRHSQERGGNLVMIEGRRMNEDLPLKGNSTTTKRLISRSSQHGSSMTADKLELKGSGLRNTVETEMQQKIEEQFASE